VASLCKIAREPCSNGCSTPVIDTIAKAPQLYSIMAHGAEDENRLPAMVWKPVPTRQTLDNYDLESPSPILLLCSRDRGVVEKELITRNPYPDGDPGRVLNLH
jgi:hypothetical protein